MLFYFISVAYIIALMFFNLAQLPFLYLLLHLFNREIYGWIIPILLLLLLGKFLILAD